MDGNNSSGEDSKQGKGRRPRKKVKYQLVQYHALPGYLRQNEYILGHYRSEWPMKQLLLSIFTIHNETFNVWTHLIGFFLFLALTIYTAMQVPKVVDLNSLQHFSDILKKASLHKLQSELWRCLPFMRDLNRLKEEISRWHVKESLYKCLHPGVKEDLANIIAIRPITRWPFYAFLGGAMFCLLASSVCHLISCHSERLSYLMLRLDFAGIAALITTSFYPTVYYSFMCYPLVCNLYMGLITILGIAAILVSLKPVFQTPEFRSNRVILYLAMGLSGAVPILHKSVLFSGEPEVFLTTGYEILMGALCGLGALVYNSRIPERWMPGKFDVVGHSNQLFHVLVLAGAYAHYRAGLVYLGWRDLRGC